MAGKRPSSLDYEAYVDELAVSSFQRALAARRFDKARAVLARLHESPDRMWRWVGFRQLAVLELALGFPVAALRALDDAARLYPDLGELAGACRRAKVELLLDTGDFSIALALAKPGSFEAALAYIGMDRGAEARTIAEQLPPNSPLAEYLSWEIESGESAALETLLSGVPSVTGRKGELSRQQHDRLRYRLGVCLEHEGRYDEAADTFSSLVGSNGVLYDQPICYVRSWFRRGRVQRERGYPLEAREAFENFLTFWSGGEMDREDVERATRWLSG